MSSVLLLHQMNQVVTSVTLLAGKMWTSLRLAYQLSRLAPSHDAGAFLYLQFEPVSK